VCLARFCDWQLKLKEDTPETWTCAAHIGRALMCPYKSLEEAKTPPYPCEDAKAPEEQEKE